MKTRVVVAAVAKRGDGAFLVATRPSSGHWEFPGGTVERGENLEEAVRREIREELGVEFYPDELLGVVSAPRFLLFFLGGRVEGCPKPVDGQHVSWARPEELAALPMLAADRCFLEGKGILDWSFPRICVGERVSD